MSGRENYQTVVVDAAKVVITTGNGKGQSECMEARRELRHILAHYVCMHGAHTRAIKCSALVCSLT